MALPTPTPFGPQSIVNPGFELGNTTGWITGNNTALASDITFSGDYSIVFGSAFGITQTVQDTKYPVYAGQKLSATVMYQQGAAAEWQNVGYIIVNYYDANQNLMAKHQGNLVIAGTGGAWHPSSINTVAPAGAHFVSIGVEVNRTRNNPSWADNFSWNYDFKYRAELLGPGSMQEGTPLQCRVSITPDGNDPVVAVRYYYMTHDGIDYENATLIGTATSAPWSINGDPLPPGNYGMYAEVQLQSGVKIITNSNLFQVGELPPPDTREFKASNSYTYLVGQNFTGLAASIPTTALITGAEVVIEYDMDVLVRSLDLGIEDPELSTPRVAFDVVSSAKLEAVLLAKNGTNYEVVGSPMTEDISINEQDFSEVESGTSEGKRWTVYGQDSVATVTIGASDLLFGQTTIAAPDFAGMSIGIRFYPALNAKPDYADSGDACYRLKVDTFKLRVYFDAGSTEYYFASPDKTQVIKADAVAGYVENGNLINGDASGTLQVTNLETVDGTASFIEAGWTIHAGYPVTDVNKIGDVAADMTYNGLPTYDEVEANRSRYMFISANFYGDPNWESIYGVNGVDRAFAYNGEYFYKIVANPEVDKDKPRHIADHHSHLALGYGEGRVDLSVVGEPYNFDGALGASSWAFGDSVTGLLPLSGTLLGVFCKKSVYGLSGTTVDNFGTQVISAKLGALEYTVTDMGFPVYANVYGLYTLSQTTEYGQYKGTPLSQDVSPWLRDRLQRDGTSDKEVVVAWPVRAKNQYKLAFADGFVLTMTMNLGSQQAPTFSKQKYFMSDLSGNTTEVDMYAQPSIVPAAISSELDHTGKERIHVAPKVS